MELPVGAVTQVLPEATKGERGLYARKNWPPGPWDKEPFDKMNWIDEATSLDCMMVRGPMGSWCGYVGVPPGHLFHGKQYGQCLKGCYPENPVKANQKALRKAFRARTLAKSRAEREQHQRFIAVMLSHREAIRSGGLFSRMKSWRCKHSNLEGALSVHGGVTFTGGCSEDGVICHIPTPGRPDDVWWIGFDTCHSQDVAPGMLASSFHMRALMEAEERERQATMKAMQELHGKQPLMVQKALDDMGLKPEDFGKLIEPKDVTLFSDHLKYDPETGAIPSDGFGWTEQYRDVDYVVKEVRELAKQLTDPEAAIAEREREHAEWMAEMKARRDGAEATA